jgi:DNA-binding XRE family transcriptional regulator
MSYGYSTRIDSLNQEADQSLLGVRLGRVCIDYDVPAAEVASQLGVSRQTVYNWFVGTHEPNPNIAKLIEDIIAEYD